MWMLRRRFGIDSCIKSVSQYLIIGYNHRNGYNYGTEITCILYDALCLSLKTLS